MARPRAPLAQRLWEKVDRSGGPDACWPYATVTRNAYGLIYDPDATNASHIIGTHVAAYKLTYGPIPDGLWVLHKCPNGNQNRRCCNPRHLYLGTVVDNALDAIADGVWVGNTRFSDEDIQAMRVLRGIWPTQKILQHFKVSNGHYSDIILGKIRPEAGGPLKESRAPTKTHCKKRHPLVEGNITYTKNGTVRNCTICYMEANRVKTRRRLSLKRDDINAQRRARRGSAVRRLNQAEVTAVEHALAGGTSYRAAATDFRCSYSTIQRIAHGTYTVVPWAEDAAD